MAFASFKRDSGLPPPQYRTPSPPLHDTEVFTATTRSDGPFKSQRSDGGGGGTLAGDKTEKPAASGLEKAGVKRRSVMEDFASIALSTESTPRTHIRGASAGFHQITASTRNQAERPHKRARSDHFPPPEIYARCSRPLTSYSQPPDLPKFEDAELLLNFSREACFAVPTLPVSQSNLTIPSNGLQPEGASFRHNGALVPNLAGKARDGAKEMTWGQSRDNSQAKRVGQGPNAHAGASQRQRSSTGDGAATNIPFHFQGDGLQDEPPIFTNIWQTDQNLADEAPSRPFGGGGHETTMNTQWNAVHQRDLDNLENLDASARSNPRGSGTATTALGLDTLVNQAATRLPTTKAKQAVEPSICASCHFSRNALTLEAEKDATSWISCDGCKSWFHFACAGFKNEREVRAVDKYRCRSCKAIHGPTTYVRKSSRAHSAIDYAGLNEGVLKTSDESPEHHYIKPIKEGTIRFQPETFARMRPELVTADYFARGDGMREPIVIPAAFNPRPPPLSNREDTEKQDPEALLDDLQDQSILNNWLAEEFEYEIVPDEGQDALDMVMPQDLTVGKVCELYGPHEKIDVIDVKSQNGEDKKWDMQRWREYYESPGSKKVRNVISLEVSHSTLGRLVRRPKVVRDLDLQDAVWPMDLRAKGEYPKVQFYCLMSVADCFTDFHIDFGGSSVFYHILKGRKTFFFIPPHDKHLKKYEEWCMSPAQNWTFLGDQTKECYRVDLSAGDTMLIPAGWIHAVWTPEDSLVIGGNFLTAMHYPMQIRIAQIEKSTGVAMRFRHPHFQKLLWYAALKYLQTDPTPGSVVESLLSGQAFRREKPIHLEYDEFGASSKAGVEYYNARYYSKHELDGLPELGRYLQRTALIANGNITDGVSVEIRNAVKRSIPKGHGEPLDLVKKFALWYTWKRGNEPIPHWAYPDYVYEASGPELTEKKLSAAALRRLEREATLQAWRMAPHRQSTRKKSQPQDLLVEPANGDASVTLNGSPRSPARSDEKEAVPKSDEVDLLEQTSKPSPSPHKKQKRGPSFASAANRKPACESCRKRRRACKHKDKVLDTREVSSGLDSRHSKVRDMSCNEVKEDRGIEGAQPADSDAPPDRQEHMAPDDLPYGTFSLLKADTIASPASESKSPTASDSAQSKSLGRSKACRECRKSKRRCVHDEEGNKDPVKVAEAALPRPTSKKRKSSSEAPISLGGKSRKAESTRPASLEGDASGFNETIVLPTSMADLPIERMSHSDFPAVEAQIQSELQPYISTSNDASNPSKASLPPAAPNAEDEVNLIDTSPLMPMKVESAFTSPLLSSSQLFSKRPTSLASPPDSTSAADADHSPSASTSAAPASQNGITPPVTNMPSRDSSHPAQHTKRSVQRCTPESGRRASSGSTAMTVVEVTPSGSLGSGMTGRRKSRGASEVAADEESMRLIRSLQAQDMGLRRRARA